MNSGELQTPEWLFDLLDGEFNFMLDAAATEENTKCMMYFSKESDALKCDWILEKNEVVWCHPPFEKDMSPWLQKAVEQRDKHGTSTVMLLPARTEAGWFHKYQPESHVRLLRGRIQLDGDDKGQALMLMLIRPRPASRGLIVTAVYKKTSLS